MAGFALLALLIFVAASAVAVQVSMESWSRAVRREREKELISVGLEIRNAIERYYQQSPGSQKVFPRSLEDLLLDSRYLSVNRHLRKIYRDPITGSVDWGLVLTPDGRIQGVFSRSEAQPIRLVDPSIPGTPIKRYTDLRFVYVPVPIGPR